MRGCVIRLFLILLLTACVGHGVVMPTDMEYVPIATGEYEIATWQRITDNTSPIHIYIEGDGHAFNSRGRPTSDPTPHGDTVRKMAANDTAANVAYIARPCQFIMSDACNVHDWTDGRFAAQNVDAVASAVKSVAGARPIVLIGYSGGALVAGLIITRNADLNVVRWVTVAGVLNHADWTTYFGDFPLITSLNMTALPNVPQTHYIAENDAVVPRALSEQWTGGAVTVIAGATHGDIPSEQIVIDKF